MIKAGKLVMVMRFKNHKSFDFIKEHKKLEEEYGNVWMLKAGKKIPKAKIDSVIGDGGSLVLRASKESGKGLFFAKILETYEGEPTKEMIYPEYYADLVSDNDFWSLDSLEGTWLRVCDIQSIDEDKLNEVKLISNGRKIVEALNSSMTSVLYAKSDVDIE